MGFDYKTAHEDGVPDDQIIEYLARNRNFDLEGARADGHEEQDILAYLLSRDAASLGAPLPEQGGSRAGKQPGLLTQGNIDTRNRPRHENADGSISTVRSKSFEIDGREVLLPTIGEDGTELTDTQAVDQYRRTGRHLGKFDTPQNATVYAKSLHEDQARRISKPSPHTVPETASPPLPLSSAFDPYGGYYNPDRGMTRAPDDNSVLIGESLGESLGEDFDTPSGSDWWNSLRGTLARQVQGFGLSRLESMEDEILGRSWPVGRGGMPKYSRSPEELRALEDDPTLIAVRDQIARTRAAGEEITAEGRDIASRNPSFWPQVVMGATNSFAASAPALATTMATRNPMASLPMMYGPTAAGSYGEMRENDVPIGLADKASTVEGIIEAITEFPAMRPFAAEMSPLMQRLGETVAADIPGETIAGLGQSVTRKVAEAGPNAGMLDPVAEGLREGLAELPVTYGTVLLTAGAHAGLGKGIEATREAARDRTAENNAEATRDRALASAQDLLNRIRGPQGKLPLDGSGSPPGAPPPPGSPPGPPGLGSPPSQQPGINVGLLSSLVPQDQFAPELPMRDPTIQPELPIDTLPPPDTTGSPAPAAGGENRTAPLTPSAQGTATNLGPSEYAAIQQQLAQLAPESRESFLEQLAAHGNIARGEIATLLAQAAADRPLSSAFQQPAAPSATPAPNKPASTPAPQAKSADSTAQDKVGGAASFTTAKGSTYTVNPDGTTTRNKAARAEHPGDEGPQEPSEATYYLTKEQADILAEIQTKGGKVSRVIAPLGDGRIGIQYTTGKQKGGFEKRTVVTPATEPAEGLIPLELWQGGKVRHFGNPITKVDRPAPAEAAPPDNVTSIQGARDERDKANTEASRERDIKRDTARIAAVAEELGRLRKELPPEKLPKKELDAINYWFARLDIAKDSADRYNATAGIADMAEKAVELMRAAKGTPPKLTVVPSAKDAETPAPAKPAKAAKAPPPGAPKQTTLFDQEGKPAEGAAQAAPAKPSNVIDFQDYAEEREFEEMQKDLANWRMNDHFDEMKRLIPEYEAAKAAVPEDERDNSYDERIKEEFDKLSAIAAIKGKLTVRQDNEAEWAAARVVKLLDEGTRSHRFNKERTELPGYDPRRHGVWDPNDHERNLQEAKLLQKHGFEVHPDNLKPAPAETTPPHTVVPYASGMSHRADLRTNIESRVGVGATITQLSGPAINDVADTIAAGKEAFVDSGAFTARMEANKGKRTEESLEDFSKVIPRYERLIKAVEERLAKQPTDHENPSDKKRNLMLVAPDVVGNQTRTLKLVKQHADTIGNWIDAGYEVVVTFQRGPMKQSEYYAEVEKALGTKLFVMGIPSNADALSDADFRELMNAPNVKPDRVHILGAINSDALPARMEVINEVDPAREIGVTADANLMRQHLSTRLLGLSGKARADEMHKILEENVQEKSPSPRVNLPPREEKPAPATKAKGKPFKLPAPPPIKTKGAKRSSKVEAQLKKQTDEFHKLWAEHKQLTSQWKADDLPAAVADDVSKVGLGLQYLKSAETFRQYTNALTNLNHWLKEANNTVRDYKPPEPPTARTPDEEARAKTLDDLIGDPTTLRLRDGLDEARGTIENNDSDPQDISRRFWTETYPKLNAPTKEYVKDLMFKANLWMPKKGESLGDFGHRRTSSLPNDTHFLGVGDWKYVSFMQFADQYLAGKQELPAVRKHKRGKKEPSDQYEPLVPKGAPVRDQAPVEPMEGEVVPLPTTEEKFGEVIDDYAGLFEDPDVKVNATDHPDYTAFMSEKAAKKRVLLWERQAVAQAKENRRLNADKVIFSLFDLTLAWSQPYIDAGYTVIPLDLQTGNDILDLSTAYIHENFPDITEAYGILIAAPCTDFTLAGNRHIQTKDESGKTELSKELVFQAMRFVDYYKPKFWVLENPAYSYIEDAAGLPKARYEFQPYDFGDPYMKRTQLWGNFNTDLPVAPVYPREGSKMHSQYGGKSQATKNARSETPKGFAYAFFKANNVADASPHERLTGEFPDAAGAIEKALEAGFSEQQIRDTIESVYEADDAKEARADLRKLVKTGEPEGEPMQLPKPAPREQKKRAKFALAAEREVQAKLKAEREERLGRGKPAAEDVAEDDEVTTQDDDVGAKAADEKQPKKAASRGGVESAMEEETEEAADTEGSSRFKRQDETIITPSTVRENLMNELGIDPTEFRLKGGQEQWSIAAQAIKDKYGYAGVFKHPRQTWRNAVDHLLDGFESLQNMAAAMDQGNKIVSLNGRVSLYMREKPGKTKGYYRHQGGLSGEPNRTIAIFNQEDVYSHELGHAIDYDLMERAGGTEPGGLSRMIRTRENTSALPNTLQEAAADVMTALYYDSAEIAQLIKKAEHQLEKAGTDKRRKELQKRLDNLRSGAWRGRGSKTQFYKRAQSGPMKEYLTKPTELFARAFEAYMSWKIQYQNSLGLVKFLGATDAVYRDEADAWIARTYPQAEERQKIFSAFDNLLGQLARENLYDTKGNPGWAKSQLNIGLMDPVAQAKAEGTAVTPEIVQAHNLTQAASETFVEDQMKLNDTLGKNWDQLMADLAAGKAGAADKFHAAMKAITSTPDGIFAFLERRYPNLPSLREIRNQLSDAAIHGRDKPVGVYRETQRQEASIRNRLEDRLKAVGIYSNMPAKWSSRMWDILHGVEKPANPEEKRQADQIRYELDYLWKLRDQTGEKIGYIDYEYLPRSFLRNISDDPRFHRDLLKLRVEEKKALIEKLNDQLAKAKTEEETKKLEAKIKAAEALNVLAMTAEQVGRMKGMKWGSPVYLGAMSEDSAKERVFGPLADKILKDYYVKDPFTLLAGYGGAAARGMVMRRRFGATPNTVFQGWLDQAALGLPSAYADILLNAMQTSLGVRRDGNTNLTRMVSAFANVQVASMLGRSVLPNISEPLNILKSSFNPLNTFGTLVKSMMPAIFLSKTTQERYAAADRFGRLSGVLVDAASSTTAMAQAMGEDVQGNGILARFSMRAYYFNMLSSLTATQEKVINRCAFELFYEAANIVRKGGKDAGMYRQWLREHGISDANAFAAYLKDNRQLDGITFENTIKEGSMAMTLANAIDHFGKTTIQKPTPSTKHIQAHNGLIGIIYRLTSWMTTNFINWAAYMKDKMMSGISGRYGAEIVPLATRFSIKGEYNGQKLTAGERLHGRIGGEQLTMGQRVGSMMVPVAMSAASMYAAQACFLVARMMLTHHDEWEDRGEDFWERFSNPKTQLQILQYWGGLGWLMSTSIDTTEATRFNRGITGTLLGPFFGAQAQDAERMIKLGLDQYAVSQGDKLPSVAVRNNAAQAIYHQVSVLLSVGLLSVLPLKNPASRLTGFLWSFFGTSPQATHEFADAVAGEKDAKLKKASERGTSAERSPARREIRRRDREKEKFDRAKESRDRQEKRQ